MNTVLQFPILTKSDRSVADVLTPEVISECVTDAVNTYGLEAFAMAFTAFGEQSSIVQKLAA